MDQNPHGNRGGEPGGAVSRRSFIRKLVTDRHRDDAPARQRQLLEEAYHNGHFGVSRRAFLQAAGLMGVSALGGALVFPQSAGAQFVPVESWIKLPSGEGKLRFTVHSDTHVGAGADNDYAKKIAAAFKAIYQIAPDVSYHFFVGDSADTGAEQQYVELAKLLNENVKKPVGIVMGNHEHYAHSGATDPEAETEEFFKRFLAEKLEVPGSFQIPGGPNEGELDCDFKMKASNGETYHFVAASAHAGGFDNSWYGDRQGWMREAFAAAAQEDSGKPIFFATHHPFPHTVWFSGRDTDTKGEANSWDGQFDENSNTEQSNKFLHELELKYPQLIHFSGHTHIPMADPRSIYQDGFTLIQTATFANNYWMESDGADSNGNKSGHPSDGHDANNCELVEIDLATNDVTVYRLDFRNGQPVIGEPWVIETKKGANAFHYRWEDMEQESKQPAAQSTKLLSVVPDSVTETGCSFSIDTTKVSADTTGLDNDLVISYRVEAYDPEDAKVYDALYMSDYYKAAANQAKTFTRPLFGAGLKSETAYTLKAYARNVFGKETLIGSAKFTTAEKPAFGAPLLAVDFASGKQDIADAPHEAKEYGEVELVKDDTLAKQVGVFNGKSALGFALTGDDYTALAQASTLEAMVNLSKVTSDYADFFSSAQDGGQGIEYYRDNSIKYYVKTDKVEYTYAVSSTEPNTWVHVVATYDGEHATLYLDGEQVAQVEATGSIPAPKASSQRWFIGADGDKNGDAEACASGKVAVARLYPGVATEADVQRLWAENDAVVDLPKLPDVDAELKGATAGQQIVLPAVTGFGLTGEKRYGVPTVKDPSGDVVDLTSAETPVTATVRSASTAIGTYTFTPQVAGTYQVFWTFGARRTDTVSFTVAEQEVGPGGNNGNGGNGNGGNGSNSGSGNGGGSGNGNGGSGNGSNGSTGGSGSGNGNNGSGSNGGNGSGSGSNNGNGGSGNGSNGGGSGSGNGSTGGNGGTGNGTNGSTGGGQNQGGAIAGASTDADSAGSHKGNASAKGDLPQTGDPSSFLSALLGGLGLTSLGAAGVAAHRMRRKDDAREYDPASDDSDRDDLAR